MTTRFERLVEAAKHRPDTDTPNPETVTAAVERAHRQYRSTKLLADNAPKIPDPPQT